MTKQNGISAEQYMQSQRNQHQYPQQYHPGSPTHKNQQPSNQPVIPQSHAQQIPPHGQQIPPHVVNQLVTELKKLSDEFEVKSKQVQKKDKDIEIQNQTIDALQKQNQELNAQNEFTLQLQKRNQELEAHAQLMAQENKKLSQNMTQVQEKYVTQLESRQNVNPKQSQKNDSDLQNLINDKDNQLKQQKLKQHSLISGWKVICERYAELEKSAENKDLQLQQSMALINIYEDMLVKCSNKPCLQDKNLLYEGERLDNNDYHGNGTVTYQDTKEIFFSGKFHNGFIHDGNSVLFDKDGRTILYEGPVLFGRKLNGEDPFDSII